MIDIKRKLVKSHDDIQIGKMLFENVPYYKRLDFWLLICTIILGGIVFFFTFRLKHHQNYLIIYLIAILLGGFLILNNEYKRRAKKKNISVDNKLLKHWLSEDYEEVRQTVFYESLIHNRLLGNSKEDIQLIKEYEELCEEESSFFKTNKGFLVGGGVMIAFILPVWSEIIKVLLKTENPDIFMNNLKLIISILVMIYMIIYSLYMIDKVLIEFANSTSRKYKSIGQQLRLLRLNLMIKFTQPNSGL
jgi:hypothetical protein